MSIYNSSDFDEMLLAHLIRSPEIFNRAKKIKLEGNDLLTSNTAGIQLYKDIAELVLRLNICPLPKNILELELAVLVDSGVIGGVEPDELSQLVDWFYTSEISNEYVNEHLVNFLRHRRFSKIQQESTSSVELYTQLTEADLSIPKTDQAVIVNPFDTPILCEANSGISTGFMRLDLAMGGGVHDEECGLLLAASGSGKTAIGVNFCIGAMSSSNTLYISLEEPYQHLIQRFYAKFYQLNYSLLKNGDEEARAHLLNNFQGMTNIERSIYRRLKVVDGRNLCPITYKGIEEIIEQTAQEGFVPKTVVIDQLDFMSAYKPMKKSAERWQEYEQISSEIDALSNYKVGGVSPIGVTLLHQIKGKPRWEYTFEDIAGYKGVVKPFDIAIGVGRMPRTSYINLHSLKTRHGEPFALSYEASFAYMSFADSAFQPDRDKKTGDVLYGTGETVKKGKKKDNEADDEEEEENDALPPPTYSGRVAVEDILPP